jgi:subtilisin family serine protease
VANEKKQNSKVNYYFLCLQVQGPEIGFLNVDKVWAKGYTGKGIVVAVVDHGVSKNQEDLKQNYVS